MMYLSQNKWTFGIVYLALTVEIIVGEVLQSFKRRVIFTAVSAQLNSV